MRKFEKITFEQFAKDISNNKELYNDYQLPKRATKNSVCYDFLAINDLTLMPGEIKKIPTGYKAQFGSDEALLILVRSSQGFKYNVRLCNQVGVVESDYYNNIDNEGHIWIALQNEGKEIYTVDKGKAFAQAMFIKYLTTDDDLSDNTRIGGIGSTDRSENI